MQKTLDLSLVKEITLSSSSERSRYPYYALLITVFQLHICYDVSSRIETYLSQRYRLLYLR